MTSNSLFGQTDAERNLSLAEKVNPTLGWLLSDAGTNPESMTTYQDLKPYLGLHLDAPLLPPTSERPRFSALHPMEIIDDTPPRPSVYSDAKLPSGIRTDVAEPRNNTPAFDEQIAKSILESWHCLEGMQDTVASVKKLSGNLTNIDVEFVHSRRGKARAQSFVESCTLPVEKRMQFIDVEPTLQTSLKSTSNQPSGPNNAAYAVEDRNCMGISASYGCTTLPALAHVPTTDRKKVRQNGLRAGVNPSLTFTSPIMSPVTPLMVTERPGMLDWTGYLDSPKDTRWESQNPGCTLDSSARGNTSVPRTNTAQLDNYLILTGTE